jgi:methylphosphotriester-DNA--protein-cysteine methyltransferase
MNFKISNESEKRQVQSYIETLETQKGKTFNVSVKLERKSRTIDQNRLMWLWLACIADETGYSRSELHEIFKEQFLGIDEKRYSIGKFTAECRLVKSTAGLDTAQFTHYLDRINAFAAAELGIRLPQPKDLWFQQFYEKYKDFI